MHSSVHHDTGKIDEKSKQKGGTPSKAFEFGKDFALQSSYVQKLRQKICTLKLYQSPPPHPGREPDEDASNDSKTKWKKRADKYGAYFLTLFRPKTELYETN